MVLAVVVTNNNQFLGHDIGFLECGLICREICWVNCRIRIVNRLGDDVADAIFSLSIDTWSVCLQTIGGTYHVTARSACTLIILGVQTMSEIERTILRCVVLIPNHRIINVIGQGITCFVANVVRETQQEGGRFICICLVCS